MPLTTNEHIWTRSSAQISPNTPNGGHTRTRRTVCSADFPREFPSCDCAQMYSARHDHQPRNERRRILPLRCWLQHPTPSDLYREYRNETTDDEASQDGVVISVPVDATMQRVVVSHSPPSLMLTHNIPLDRGGMSQFFPVNQRETRSDQRSEESEAIGPVRASASAGESRPCASSSKCGVCRRLRPEESAEPVSVQAETSAGYPEPVQVTASAGRQRTTYCISGIWCAGLSLGSWNLDNWHNQR